VTLVLPAYAKLNLELRVLGHRPDGRHEMSSVLQAISLHDLLDLEPASVTSLDVIGFNLPVDESNLVLKALRALEAVVGRALPTRMRLVKRIPPGSGLGGGSSNAAAALRGLSRIHDLSVDIAPLAADLGSDVPFFLTGGCARATGHGERVEAMRVERGWFAIAWPEIQISTADVYKRWDEVRGEPPNELQTAALDLCPQLATYRDQLGDGWRLTGSGSAWFKSYPSRTAAENAAKKSPGWTAVASAVGAWA
jgi:4-diphosphocytidyl-2-C-methyl-D-erythritol kinase